MTLENDNDGNKFTIDINSKLSQDIHVFYGKKEILNGKSISLHDPVIELNPKKIIDKSIDYPEPTNKDRPIGATPPHYVNEKRLIGNMDAKVWAEEFVKLCKTKPGVALDEGTMIGWFANAIMAGYDTAMRKCEKKKDLKCQINI